MQKLMLITGGSKGLGKALVETYVQQKYRVLEFSRSGTTEVHVGCDFSNPEESSTVIEATLLSLKDQEFSEIVLINNAGVIDPIGPLADSSTSDWLNSININFMAAVLTTGLFIKQFQSHICPKSVVMISSGAAVKPKYGWSLYCAAKAGLEQFAKNIALEQASQDYPVNSVVVNPGIIDTGMQSIIRKTEERLFPEVNRFVGFKEAGELVEPLLVAEKIFGIVSRNKVNGAKYSVKDSLLS